MILMGPFQLEVFYNFTILLSEQSQTISGQCRRTLGGQGADVNPASTTCM